MQFSSSTTAFFAIGEHYIGEPPILRLQSVLSLEASELTVGGSRLLAEPPDSDLGSLVMELAQAIRAYIQFQDLMETELTSEPLEARHFCYYESLVYLREATIALLNGQVLASLTLSRPLIELAIFHLYWRGRGRSQSYKSFYDWLGASAGKAPFKNALDVTSKDLTGSNAAE